MMIAEDWNGQDLKGKWVATKKLDGVRALSDGHIVTSRKGKPLYGLARCAHLFNDAEIYCGSFKETLTVVRSHDERPVHVNEIFPLDPVDDRLVLRYCINPTADEITELMNATVIPGQVDGIVLRQDYVWLKCKPILTFDVKVIGIQPGQGKHYGRMGALITTMGKVGTGFTDAEREALLNCTGQTIEVSCLELTEDGKFRHPRFVRLRPDKD